MYKIITESLFILLLILLNGFFSAAEIAIISIRRSRTHELVQKGDKRAKIIEDLRDHPETFLATIQIGITVISTCASAFGGASLVEQLVPLVRQIPVDFIQQHADGISFTFVVVLISYFSLILGELVPKSLALSFAEKIALFVSYPLKAFSIICYAFIKFLTYSSNLILLPFKKSTNFTETKLSEEEIRYVIAEGRQAGTIEKREHEILENVFEFGDVEVRKIMIPPNKMTAFDIEEDDEKLIEKIIESGYSRVPIFKDQIDNIIGIVYVKDLFKKLAFNEKIKISELLRPAIFIPMAQQLHDVLQKLKREKLHIAIVIDEHGGVAGIVTLEDILEELVGEISDESDDVSKDIIKQSDGTYLVEGSTSISDFNRIMKTKIPEDGSYQTISGFILELMKRFPRVGEKVIYKKLQFRIKEKTTKIIKRVVVTKKHNSAKESKE